MKRFGLVHMVILALFLPATLEAGTFQNTDPDDYGYEAIIDGIPTYGTLYGNSALYGFCNNGCVLKLIDSGQTIQMGPNDHVVINDGTLQRQDD
jgi:hypothetical protein